MKIKDLKIGIQLKISFGIILFLIVVLGVIAWQQTNKIAQRTTEFYDHPYKVRKAIGELNVDIMAMRLEFRNFLLAEDEKGRQTALLNSDFYQTNAEKQFEVLSDLYLGPRKDIDNAQKAFTRWVTIRKSNLALGQTSKVSQAMRRIEENGDIGMEREKLLISIKKIDEFAHEKADLLFINANEINNSLNNQLGLLVAAILALTVLIVYLLNKNIRQPIAELANVTKLFRDGKTNVRSSYASQNEFGQLSASFNDLAETIETELNLNNHVAKLADVMLSEDDAHRFCHAVLGSLLEHTESQLGAVYLLNDEKTEFHHFECIGMDLDGCKPFSAVQFDGEFGAALASKKLQHIAGIPEDTQFAFSTVSGKFTPREIITIPIVSGDETVVVISLATIKSFSKNSVRLVDTVLSTLSARMDGILAYRKIITFSQQLEKQNIELEVQKRELSAQASELGEQNIELEMQKKQLNESNRLKSSFLSNMSHELRTPLNSVIALSGVLNRRLSGKIGAEEFNYLDVIERNGKQLLSLINDILDLSRIEAGYEELEIRKFNMNDLVREVVDMLEPQAIIKNITLSYQAGNDRHDISSDYVKCRHILQNLVANAVKFTEIGDVRITVEAKIDTIQIAVADTGIGIAQEHLSHIFDEFRQADGSSSRKYGGTGLGLAIAKKYAHLLGGSIKVESIPGKGSLFIISLPLQIPNQQLVEEKYVASVRPFVTKSGPFVRSMQAGEKTILLVEDSEAVIIQMKDMLSREGYTIMVASNGNEALQQIKQKIPDAMILDLMMPGVDGFEVLRSIREEEKTDHLPVIILTAKYVTKEELAFLKHNSIHQLIQKGNINKDQLLETVAQMFPELKVPKAVMKNLTPIQLSGAPVVLVVEDNADNMLTIKALLDGKCSIVEAEDGQKGIEMAHLHQPQLILMDIALPLMNGIEVLAELRKVLILQNIPVIAVSASAMKGDREDFIAQGFDGYIPKPIDSVLFDKTIKEFLNFKTIC